MSPSGQGESAVSLRRSAAWVSLNFFRVFSAPCERQAESASRRAFHARREAGSGNEESACPCLLSASGKRLGLERRVERPLCHYIARVKDTRAGPCFRAPRVPFEAIESNGKRHGGKRRKGNPLPAPRAFDKGKRAGGKAGR